MSLHDFYQKMKKKKNQDKIIELINLGEKSYKQLESQLKFSGTTLSKHLNELSKRREIKKVVLNGEVEYKLSDKGIISPNDILHLSTYVKKIKKRGGEAFYDYSQLQGEILSSSLPWGITSHLIIDKDLKKLKLLTRDDVRDIEKIIFEKIVSNIKNDKIKRNVKNGDLEIGFNVDYTDLVKSINADSLKYFENMSKDESSLLSKINIDPESVTNKELKRLQKLREKTYEKIKDKKTR